MNEQPFGARDRCLDFRSRTEVGTPSVEGSAPDELSQALQGAQVLFAPTIMQVFEAELVAESQQASIRQHVEDTRKHLSTKFRHRISFADPELAHPSVGDVIARRPASSVL
ncbi:MAG: hypothetical protein OXH09_14080 [Gammaproteobacteria bacterium]|nr:hypothetical protein [Gammaproteobacteria bacterium]